MTYSFVCPECQQPFITRIWDQQFCSKRCCDLHQRLAHKRLLEALEGKKIDVKERCFFSSHIPLEEIQRLMDLKK